MYSNRYIFIYATVMVVIVAVILSTIATVLKPYQDANVKLEKVQNILASVNIESTKSNAFTLFDEHIKTQYVIRHDGSYAEGNAFEVDMKAELRKSIEDREMPLIIAEDKTSKKNYIIPLYGGGLWGPLWGYVALQEDFNTINGVILDHQGETPGLGAEISMPFFENQFKGKKIFDQNMQFVSVAVLKGGNTQNNPHAVDGISGGTITSDGVTDMFKENISFYMNYYEKNIKNK